MTPPNHQCTKKPGAKFGDAPRVSLKKDETKSSSEKGRFASIRREKGSTYEADV